MDILTRYNDLDVTTDDILRAKQHVANAVAAVVPGLRWCPTDFKMRRDESIGSVRASITIRMGVCFLTDDAQPSDDTEWWTERYFVELSSSGQVGRISHLQPYPQHDRSDMSTVPLSLTDDFVFDGKLPAGYTFLGVSRRFQQLEPLVDHSQWEDDWKWMLVRRISATEFILAVMPQWCYGVAMHWYFVDTARRLIVGEHMMGGNVCRSVDAAYLHDSNTLHVTYTDETTTHIEKTVYDNPDIDKATFGYPDDDMEAFSVDEWWRGVQPAVERAQQVHDGTNGGISEPIAVTI